MRFSVLIAASALIAGVIGRAPPTAPDVAWSHSADTTLVARGQLVFESICSTCHTIDPPHKLAPPMRHVSGYYRNTVGDSAATIARIVAFISEPSLDKSLMPARMRERFGLMPPVSLTEEQRRAVAHFVWALGDAEAEAPGGQGRRGGMHGGMHGPPSRPTPGQARR